MAMTFDVGAFQSARRSAFGADLRFRASTASTQDDLRAALEAGAAEGCVCLALEQSAGRGRFGRIWQGKPLKSLLFSVALKVPASAPLSQAPIVLGLAAVHALRSLGLAKAQVKWPNDLVWRDKKLGGCLVEQQGPWLAAGLGLNVGQRGDDWPAELADSACSLAQAGLELGLEEALSAMLQAVEWEWRRWQSEGFEGIRADWEAVAALRERELRILPAPGAKGPERRGQWERLNGDGSLQVKLNDNTSVSLASAEVSLAQA
jgi:BirA family biotin operon repressor/biotin-[acetyl-CoA-carboxylase] ligase